MHGQILGGDSILTLTSTFSRVMRVSTGSDVSSAPSIEQYAIISGRGRGCVTILGDEDVNPYVNVDLIEAERVPLRKAHDNIGIVDVVITSPKSAGEI